MSKIVCIPGSTTFRPLEDIISIDIHVRLLELTEVYEPSTSIAEFMIAQKSVIKIIVATKYAVDKKSEEDDDDKTYDVATKHFDFHTFDIGDTQDLELASLTESETYTGLTERLRDQIDVRMSKYKEYMKYDEARISITEKLDNISPVSSASKSEVVEEEDPALERGPRILENLDPDRSKLEEIMAFLAENQNAQSKRLPYIQDKFAKTHIVLDADDGYEFIKKLEGINYDKDIIDTIKSTIDRCVESVSDLFV